MFNIAWLSRYRIHHVLFWLLVFGVWFYLRGDEYSTYAMALLVTAIKVADIAVLIYIANYILVPKLLYRKKYFLFVFLFIAMVMASSMIKMSVLGRILDNSVLLNWWVDFKERLYDNILPHFFLVIAGVAVRILLDYGQLQKRMAETAKEKAEAELNFLKSQINPHFLFNSLNSVYFLIDRNNLDARNALHKFSEMLRYQLYEAGGDRIPVEKEIHYLRDYMDLQLMRKDEKYTVEFNCGEDVKDFSIEPLLLSPFVENAFKHISHFTDRTNFVKVELSRSNGVFHFIVENSREEGVQTEAGSGGIGMVNVKRRLELLYPGKHELHIAETPENFRVNLNLHLS